jgi:SNF2 family DNA or RNA helicase
MEHFLDKYIEDLEICSSDEEYEEKKENDHHTSSVTTNLNQNSSGTSLNMYSHNYDNLYPEIRYLTDVVLPPIPTPIIREEKDNNWNNLERIEQPADLNIKLFPHQCVSVYDMETLERTRKIELHDVNNSYYSTDFGILGDIPGYGKGLSVVSLVLRDKMPWDVSVCHTSSSIESYGELLRFYSHHSTRKRVKTNFILASPNLIEQWKEYFGFVEKGKLSVKEISTRKDIEDGIDYKKWDVLIVSSARYNELMNIIGTEIVWKRFIFDDAASTYISNMSCIRAGFTWFITATYQSLVNIRSKGYIRDFFRFFDSRILRHLVIKNPEEFCKSSFKMPEIIEINHQCANPRVLSVLRNHIDSDVQMMLSAGDVKGAITRLGAGISSSDNLIEIVSKRHKEKLTHARMSLDMWQSRTGAHALKEVEMWNKRIDELNNLIAELDKKYKEVLSEDCSICYDTINVPTMVKCCQNIFCGSCIIECLKNGSKCPMCRSIVNTKELIYIVANKEDEHDEKKEEIKREIILPKQDKVVEIIKKGLERDPKKKFLIFSSFDESFQIIKNALTESHMKFAEISGTKATRDLKIKNFKDGKIPVLFLNAAYNGCGLNLQSTTDVILYHEMPPHIRTQNIGRAMRIGRSEPLTVHNLKI